MTDISTAIQSLNTKGGNSHEYVMTGTPTNKAEYNSQVKFISGADANGTAIFSCSISLILIVIISCL